MSDPAGAEVPEPGGGAACRFGFALLGRGCGRLGGDGEGGFRSCGYLGVGSDELYLDTVFLRSEPCGSLIAGQRGAEPVYPVVVCGGKIGIVGKCSSGHSLCRVDLGFGVCPEERRNVAPVELSFEYPKILFVINGNAVVIRFVHYV